MTTAILVVISFIVTIAIFMAGFFIGGWLMGKKLGCDLIHALEESDISEDKQLKLLEKLKEKIKK